MQEGALVLVLRKLTYIHVEKTAMTLFYHVLIESVLSCSLLGWFGNFSLRHRNRLDQIVRWSRWVTSETQLSQESPYIQQLEQIATSPVMTPIFCPLIFQPGLEAERSEV